MILLAQKETNTSYRTTTSLSRTPSLVLHASYEITRASTLPRSSLQSLTRVGITIPKMSKLQALSCHPIDYGRQSIPFRNIWAHHSLGNTGRRSTQDFFFLCSPSFCGVRLCIFSTRRVQLSLSLVDTFKPVFTHEKFRFPLLELTRGKSDWDLISRPKRQWALRVCTQSPRRPNTVVLRESCPPPEQIKYDIPMRTTVFTTDFNRQMSETTACESITFQKNVSCFPLIELSRPIIVSTKTIIPDLLVTRYCLLCQSQLLEGNPIDAR